jgi:hypothetical protein
MAAWMEKAERAQAAVKRLREHAEATLPKAIHATEAVAAGTLCGAVRGAFEATGKEYAIPGPGGVKIPPEVLIGALTLAVAASGQTDLSDDLFAIGGGVLAYSGGREAENYFRTRKKTDLPPGTVQ